MIHRPWSERVTVVTGAGSGIGRAIALAFAARGAAVHAADIDATSVEETAVALRAAGARAAYAHHVDCRDAAAVEALAEAALSSDGRVEVLVNNAGVAHAGAVEDTSLDEWHRVLDINLFGVIHGIKAFVEPMLAQGEGHIVNISSGLGLMGFPHLAIYCASKFAVVGLSESLNIELGGRGVHVSAVCPGIIRTNIANVTPVEGPVAGVREAIRRFYAERGADPSVVARDTLRAIEARRPVQLSPGHVWPLFLLHKASRSTYHRIIAEVRRRILR